MDMTTMNLPPAARVASTKGSNPQFDLLTSAIRAAMSYCACNDCMPYAYIGRGALRVTQHALPQAPSTTLLAMAKRGFVTIDKCGARIVGAYVTDLGRRWQLREATAKAYAERTARIVEGR